MVTRKLGQAASAGFVKHNDFERFWPLPNKFKRKPKVFTPEEIEAIKKAHNIQ